MENWLKTGKYEVSDFGRVRSKRGMLNPSPRKNGYVYIKIEGQKQIGLHRLIAKMFIPNPLNLKDVNHKNGNKADNRAINLEWANRRENITHGVSKGLTGATYAKGKNRWRAQIGFGSKDKKHLGCFATEQEAHLAYLEALKEYGLKNKYAKPFQQCPNKAT